ncbi:MAG: PLP-dependent aminotransferase family protein [Bacillota bacterium]
MEIEWQYHFAERAKHINGSQIRQFFALTERPEVISFAGGFPGNDFFPRNDISGTLLDLLREEQGQALQYGPTEGNYELRDLIAKKRRLKNEICDIDNLIIIDGSQQGLDLLSRILVNPGETVLVEDPAYIGGMSAIKSYGGIPVGISMDSDGPIPSEMEQTIKSLTGKGKKPKLFYTVPNFQNPTGVTTSLQRRREILKIASSNNLVIIEDDPYGDLCYEGDVPEDYKSLDHEGRVIYLGSYSKILIPGIRIGWMAGPKMLIEKITMAKQTADLCSSTLGQQLVFRLARDGFIDRHIGYLVELYRQKRDAMFDTMSNYFPSGIDFKKPKGGFFIWVNFPRHYPPARELLEISLIHNVAFVHGEGFSSNGNGVHSARFSFSQPRINEITAGVKILGQLFNEVETNFSLKAVGH